MKIMGMPSYVNWLGWFIMNYAGMILLCVLCVIVILVGKLLGYSDPIILLLYLMDFSFATLMMW